MEQAAETSPISYQNQKLVSLQTDENHPEQAGIQPSGKSRIWNITQNYQKWGLPGQGEPKEDCGTARMMGCLNSSQHHGEYEGKIYFIKTARSCKQASCPTCYEKWASREGHRAVRRIVQYQTKMKPLHVIASAPPGDYSLSYKKLKQKMLSALKSVGVIGSMEIFHPYRSHCNKCKEKKKACKCSERGIEHKTEYYPSPHFHVIALAPWIKGEDVTMLYRKTGWLIKNLGVRDSLSQTISYQLSHAGVHTASQGTCSVHGANREECKLIEKYPLGQTQDCIIIGKEAKHPTISWSGCLSYNKLKVTKEEMSDKQLCILCESEMQEIVFTAYSIDYENIFEFGKEYFEDPEGWEYVSDRYKPQEPKHQPASFEDLKGIDA